MFETIVIVVVLILIFVAGDRQRKRDQKLEYAKTHRVDSWVREAKYYFGLEREPNMFPDREPCRFVGAVIHGLNRVEGPGKELLMKVLDSQQRRSTVSLPLLDISSPWRKDLNQAFEEVVEQLRVMEKEGKLVCDWLMGPDVE